MPRAKFLDECYMFCGLCILMHVNLKHVFACVGSSPTEKKERPRSRDATNRTCKNMQADAG